MQAQGGEQGPGFPGGLHGQFVADVVAGQGVGLLLCTQAVKFGDAPVEMVAVLDLHIEQRTEIQVDVLGHGLVPQPGNIDGHSGPGRG